MITNRFIEIEIGDKLEKTDTTTFSPIEKEMFDNLKNFKDTNHWDIKTYNEQIDNRTYSTISMSSIRDTNHVIFSQLDSIHIGPLQIELNNRSDLIDHLYRNGFKRPLIIDNSCADFIGISKISFLDFIKKNVRGGTRKKKRKKKSANCFYEHLKQTNALRPESNRNKYFLKTSTLSRFNKKFFNEEVIIL